MTHESKTTCYCLACDPETGELGRACTKDEKQQTTKRFYAALGEDGWEVCARPYSINEEPITLLVYENQEEAKSVRDKFNKLMDEV